jgi:acetylglutamate kinase
VLGQDKQRLPVLTLRESQALIESGLATGGMLAKLNAAGDALLGGIRQVVIAPGSAPDGIARLLAGEALGTRLVKEHGDE